MILQCEACGTKFEVADEAFASGGRQVLCTVCKHRWFYDPAAPAVKEETAVEHASAAEKAPEEKVPEEKIPPEKPLAAPKRYAGARPARRYFRAGPPRWLSALSVAMFLIVCGLGALNFAPRMVGFPATQDFVLQGLSFHPAQGAKGYILTGSIVNKGEKAKAAPDLRLSLVDDKGGIAKTWRRDLNGASVEGGGKLDFMVDGLDAPSGMADPHIRVELGNALEFALRRQP